VDAEAPVPERHLELGAALSGELVSAGSLQLLGADRGPRRRGGGAPRQRVELGARLGDVTLGGGPALVAAGGDPTGRGQHAPGRPHLALQGLGAQVGQGLGGPGRPPGRQLGLGRRRVRVGAAGGHASRRAWAA